LFVPGRIWPAAKQSVPGSEHLRGFEASAANVLWLDILPAYWIGGPAVLGGSVQAVKYDNQEHCKYSYGIYLSHGIAMTIAFQNFTPELSS
jgi:hypothetical protein